MSARLMPYAAHPGRATGQVAGDIGVALWVAAWLIVARIVYGAISAFGEVGRRVQSGAGGIARNLDDAGDSAGRVPLVGDALGAPLRAAGGGARDLAAAGQSLVERADLLAVVLAVAVSLPPILGVVVPWARTRLRFARRAAATAALAATTDGQRLLALRALATRPLADLAAVHSNPLEAWRRNDPAAIHGLAAMEIRESGVRLGAADRSTLPAG